jgi:hypothetical protein
LAEPIFHVNDSTSPTWRQVQALMLVRLTRSRRLTAGWTAALVYLLCVLAPGAALAFGRGPAPCFIDEVVPVAIIAKSHDSAPMTHRHADGTVHDHDAMHGHHHADAGDAPPAHHHDGKTHDGMTSPGPCCAMLCVTALPADLPLIVKPSQPTSLCAAEAEWSAPGKAPPLLYRPPIA